MRKVIIAGNWKMNGSQQLVAEMSKSLTEAALPKALEVVLFPPSTYVSKLSDLASCFKTGLQNVYHETSGAFTGELSPQIAKDVGCDYILVGHSERRSLFNESNGDVALKVKAICDAGLKPVLCVGETLDERESGQYLKLITAQVLEGISLLGDNQLANVTLAYEPVWAIGTGETASPLEAQEVHREIRLVISNKFGHKEADDISILYGGSVNASNADALFAQPDIDGGLVGGASLKVTEFLTICSAAAVKV